MIDNFYTEDGLILLPDNILITKNNKKSTMYVFDFSTIQQKKENDNFSDILDELIEFFNLGNLGNKNDKKM